MELMAFARTYKCNVLVLPEDASLTPCCFSFGGDRPKIALWHTKDHFDLLLPEQGKNYPGVILQTLAKKVKRGKCLERALHTPSLICTQRLANGQSLPRTTHPVSAGPSALAEGSLASLAHTVLAGSSEPAKGVLATLSPMPPSSSKHTPASITPCRQSHYLKNSCISRPSCVGRPLQAC